MNELFDLVNKQTVNQIPTSLRPQYNCEHCHDKGFSIAVEYFGKEFPGFFYPKKFYPSIVNYQRDWVRLTCKEIYMEDPRALENYHCYTDRAIPCACSSKHKFIIKQEEKRNEFS